MADAWDEFSDAKPSGQDQWAGFEDYDMTGPNDRAPRKKPKSITLGVLKGLDKPFENVSRVNPLNVLDNIPGVGEARAGGMAKIRNFFTQAEKTQKPAPSGVVAGEIIGTLPAMYATKNPFIAGAIQGAALTDARDPVGVGMDMAGGAATNWFGGKVVEKAANLVAPVIDPAVRRLSDAGVSLTPGMVKGGKAMGREDKRMSRPFVGDAITAARQGTQDTFNRATVNEALKPLGKSIPTPIKTGHDAVDWARTEVSNAYETIIPNLSVNIHGPAFAQKLLPVAQSLPAAQRKEFQRQISINLKQGHLQGQELKAAQAELRRLKSVYGRSQNAHDHELARAFDEADQELTGIMLAQNPTWAPQLQATNTAYRGLMVVEGAAKGADEGVFNTGQLKTSVRQGDRSKGKTQTARGRAYMQDFSEDARKVIPARTPDSGTSGRSQSANLFANLGGAASLAGYKGEELMARIALLPRSQQAAALADVMRRLGGPAGAGAVATANQSGN